MKTIELFAGTKSFSKVMAKHKHKTFTIDNNPEFNCDMTADLLFIDTNLFLEANKDVNVIWMSPPCTTFSLASGNTHWTADRQPKTAEAVLGRQLLLKCESIANWCIKNNKIFFIENPNGRAVWFLPDNWLKRVWYCQYGDTRAKPTNIWTNLEGWTPKTCKNYNYKQVRGLEKKHCHHEQARRGAKTGTQGLKGARERSIIPPKLFEEILDHIKKQRDNTK